MTDTQVYIQDNRLASHSLQLRQKEEACNYQHSNTRHYIYFLCRNQGMPMWIFPSHAGWNLGKEILHTFYVGDVALRETKHTEKMHTCSLLIHFQPRHIFLFFSSVVYQIKTSILSFWQVCHDVIQPHSDILSPTLGCWWSVGKWYVFKSNCGAQKPETLAYSCI